MCIVKRLTIFSICLLASMLVLPGVGPVQAQSPQQTARAEARRLLREGNRAFERGNHAAALEKFEKAMQVFPSPRIHYNIGQALRLLGRPVEAVEAFEAFLKDARRVTAQERKETTAAMQELQSRVARLTLTTNVPEVAITIDNRSRGTTPLPGHLVLAPGNHEVTLGRAGYRPLRETITLSAGEHRKATFNLMVNEPVRTPPPLERVPVAPPAYAPPPSLATPPVAVAPPAGGPPAPIGQPTSSPLRLADPEPARSRPHTIVGVSLLAASAALAAGGGLLMGSAWSRFNEAEGNCRGDCDAVADDVDRRILWSKLLFGAAALSGAGGAGVLLFSPRASDSRRASGAGVLLVKGGRF